MRISKNVCGRNLVVGRKRVQVQVLLFSDFSAQGFISDALKHAHVGVRVLDAHERLAGEIWHKFVGFILSSLLVLFDIGWWVLYKAAAVINEAEASTCSGVWWSWQMVPTAEGPSVKHQP